MDDSQNRKIGVLLTYILIFANTIIALLYTPFLIKKLGQNEYGLYSLISSVIGYLTVLDLGFGNAIVVFTAKYRAKKDDYAERKMHGMFFVIFFIIGIIAGIAGLILFFNVNSLFGKTMTDLELYKAKIMILILTFNLVISFIFNIYSCILNAYEKFVFQKVVSLIITILKPLLMSILLIQGYKSITLVIVITISNIIVLLSNYIYCNKKLKIKIKFLGFDKKIFKTIFGYSIWIFLGIIVDKINWSVDQFVLGAVSGTVAVSIYSISSILNTLFINLSTAISGVLLPKMTKMVANNSSSSQLTDEFIKVGRIQYYIIFLMCSGLIFVGKEFIYLWVGKEFEQSYYVALMLIIPLCFPLIQNLGLSIMQAMNKYKFKSISTFIMAIVNVIISVILAKKYGPIGSATGTAIAIIICNIILINIYYYKVIKLNIIKFWKSILKMTLSFSIPILIEILLIYNTNFSGIVYILFHGIIYSIIFCLNSYFITMNSYEKELIKKFFKISNFKGGKNLNEMHSREQ